MEGAKKDKTSYENRFIKSELSEKLDRGDIKSTYENDLRNERKLGEAAAPEVGIYPGSVIPVLSDTGLRLRGDISDGSFTPVPEITQTGLSRRERELATDGGNRLETLS